MLPEDVWIMLELNLEAGVSWRADVYQKRVVLCLLYRQWHPTLFLQIKAVALIEDEKSLCARRSMRLLTTPKSVSVKNHEISIFYKCHFSYEP